MKEKNIPLCNRRIKQLRLEKKLSQAQLAEYAGVSKNYVSMIETGTRNPSEDFLRRLGNILAADYDWLITEHYTERDSALDLGGYENLVNQFDGRRLQQTPMDVAHSVEDIDLSLLLWFLLRFSGISYTELAARLDVDNDVFMELLSGASTNNVSPHKKNQLTENAISLIGETGSSTDMIDKLNKTISLIESEHSIQYLKTLERVFEAHLKNEEGIDAVCTNAFTEAKVPGVVGSFQLLDKSQNQPWVFYVCKPSQEYKRKDWYKRIAETVIEQTKNHSNLHHIVWVTEDMSAFTKILMATEVLAEPLSKTLPQYYVALARNNFEEVLLCPCPKRANLEDIFEDLLK